MSCMAGERPTSGMESMSSGSGGARSLFFGSLIARPTMASSSLRSKGFGRYS